MKPAALLERPARETLSTGIAEVDALIGGIPRGAITEICGCASSGRTSGRTSLLFSILASATAAGHACALVDASDTFDPSSASAAGVVLDRLLWVRCAGKLEQAVKAADLLLHAGGFGVVALDLGELPLRTVRHIPLTLWFRFRRAIEKTPTALIALERAPTAQSSAALVLELEKARPRWSGRLLKGAAFRVRSADCGLRIKKPAQSTTCASFETQALA